MLAAATAAVTGAKGKGGGKQNLWRKEKYLSGGGTTERSKSGSASQQQQPERLAGASAHDGARAKQLHHLQHVQQA